MDIFFFITSLIALVSLFLIVVVGIYIMIIVHKVKKIASELEKFTLQATVSGMESIENIMNKIDSIIDKGGVVERVIVSVLGMVFARTFKNRGKIKRDAPKK